MNKHRGWSDTWRRFRQHRLAVVGAVVLVLIVLTAALTRRRA